MRARKKENESFGMHPKLSVKSVHCKLQKLLKGGKNPIGVSISLDRIIKCTPLLIILITVY